MKRYEEVGRGGESERQREDVQTEPGMSRWIWWKAGEVVAVVVMAGHLMSR